MKLAMGQCDIPQKQDQPVFELDLYRHNIVVMGASMSGKTTFVKTHQALLSIKSRPLNLFLTSTV